MASRVSRGLPREGKGCGYARGCSPESYSHNDQVKGDRLVQGRSGRKGCGQAQKLEAGVCDGAVQPQSGGKAQHKALQAQEPQLRLSSKCSRRVSRGLTTLRLRATRPGLEQATLVRHLFYLKVWVEGFGMIPMIQRGSDSFQAVGAEANSAY